MLYEAYCVSPTGEVIGVGVTHIERVIEDPGLFGVTIEYVREVYKKFGDPLGFEGKASASRRIYGGETPLFSVMIILFKVLTLTPVQFGLVLI